MLRISLGAIAVIILVLCLSMFRQAGEWRRQQQWVEHSYQVRVGIEELDRTLREAESTQRAILLFGEEVTPDLRAKYEEFRNNALSGLERLRELVADNPEQAALTARLGEMLGERVAMLERNIAGIHALDDAAKRERIGAGVALSGEIESLLGVIRRNESRLLAERTGKARKGTGLLLALAGVGSAAGVGVLVLAWSLDRKSRRMQHAYQEKLAAARDAALDSVKTTSNFVASVSHEIRTPMNGIVGASDLLRMDPKLGAEQRELVELIRRSGAALLSLVNDILDLSKLQAGRMDFVREDLSLPDLLDEVLALFAAPAARKRLELTYTLDADVPRRVSGDPNRLRQVLVNLVGNAVKFTDSGSVSVTVARVPVDDPRPVLRFGVADTGPGLTEEERSLLFMPFNRVNASLAARHDGTGLGLAISREIVQRMEGSMGVDSEPGEGAAFWFTARFDAAESPDTPSGRLGDGGVVLVIESRERTAAAMREHLAAWGLEPRCWSGPGEWGEAPLPENLRAVIVGEPAGCRWQEALSALAERGDLGGARVLVMPPPDEAPDREEMERLGVDGRLRFPFRPSELYNHLAREASGGESAAEVPAAAVEKLPHARILLVEDNPVNQRIFTRQLEALGLEVVVRGDGAEGVEGRMRDDVAAVLMDCQLPVIDGFEATRRIRAWEAEHGRPRMPVIAVTAHVMVGDAEECFRAGMDDYLPKPFDLAKLRTVLGRWLRPRTPVEDAGPVESASGFAGEDDPIDFSQLGECLTGDGEADAELIRMALDEAEARLHQMMTALASGDDETWRRAAHRGRGSSATVGFAALAEAFGECEHDEGGAASRAAALKDLGGLLGFTRRQLGARFSDPVSSDR